MTKSLLTQQDIKNFILEEIDKASPRKDCYFVRRHICYKLGISEYVFIHKFEKAGLKPSFVKGTRNYYNVNHVIKWADEHNLSYVVTNEI
jgi:hypothetical protein